MFEFVKLAYNNTVYFQMSRVRGTGWSFQDLRYLLPLPTSVLVWFY